MVSVGCEVIGSITVSVPPFMLLTIRSSRPQSGVMCSGASPTANRSTTSKVAGSITVTSSDSSFGTYTRSGTPAALGSISPLTVAAYTPPVGSGVGVGSTLGDAETDGLELGTAAALVAAALAEVDWLGAGVEQAARRRQPARTVAHRRRPRLNACCRCGPG